MITELTDAQKAAHVSRIVLAARLSTICHYQWLQARNELYARFLEPKLKVELQYGGDRPNLKSPLLKIKITLGMHEKLKLLQDVTLKSLEVFKRMAPEVIHCDEGITMTYEWHKMHDGTLPVTLTFPEDHPFVEDPYN